MVYPVRTYSANLTMAHMIAFMDILLLINIVLLKMQNMFFGLGILFAGYFLSIISGKRTNTPTVLRGGVFILKTGRLLILHYLLSLEMNNQNTLVNWILALLR